MSDDNFELADPDKASGIINDFVIGILLKEFARGSDTIFGRKRLSCHEYIKNLNTPVTLYCLKNLGSDNTISSQYNIYDYDKTRCFLEILANVFRDPILDDKFTHDSVDKKYYSFVFFIYKLFVELPESRLSSQTERNLIPVVREYL